MRTPWLWLAVACSFMASAVGSYLVSFVSNDALKKIILWMLGAKFIRPVFLAVVLALTVKLIWDAMQM